MPLPLLPIFVLFSPAFFVLCVVAWCLFWWAMEYDSGKGATGVLAAFIVIITLFGGMQAWHWMYDHPGKLFGISLLGGEHWWHLGLVYDYVFLGVGWAVAHWIIFCRDDRADYEEYKAEWLEEKGIKGNKIPEENKEEWLKYCAGLRRGWVITDTQYEDINGRREPVNHFILQVQQKAKNHKGRIMTWMAYWPFSLTWWALRDLLRKLWERLYRMIGSTLDKLSAYIYKGVDDDFPADTPKSAKQVRRIRIR